MIRIIPFGFLLFLVVALSNCKKDELNPSVIINVEDDFYVDLFEDISNGENIFKINIKSIKDQDCLNAVIDYTPQILEGEDRIILAINDILEPEICIPGRAPAFTSVPFENIKEKAYNIQINLKDIIINEGSLVINSKEYFLEMSTENGLELVHDRLYKIPKKAIWGYVGYEEENHKMIAENFIKDLEEISSIMSISDNFDIGYYGYFTILEDRSVLLHQEIEDKFLNSFLFYYDAESQEIIDLIDSYCSSNPEINFHVFNGEGEEMKCQ